MITKLTTPFIEKKAQFIDWLKANEYAGYRDLLQKALELAVEDDETWEYGEQPDPTRIHQIDDGDYQGTYVFVVATAGYQPYVYYATLVSYGSCSGCDTLQAAWDYGHDHNYEALYSLALNMLQGLKRIDDE